VKRARLDRQPHRNRRAFARPAAECDRAATEFDVPFGVGQTQSRSAGFRGEVRLERPANTLLVHTDTGINHADFHRIRVGRRLDAQESAVGHRLNRVFDEVHEDLFETITFYDDRAVKAQARKRPDGKYDVDLTVTARKSRADSAGNEQEVPLDATMDIGVQDAKGLFLALEKRRVKSGENRFTIEVAGEPARAGIDPLNKMIDRDASDNLIDVVKSN